MSDQNADDRALDAMRRSDSEESRREAQRALDAGKTVGTGMTSVDSTEAPLSAQTGEPDDRAMGYGSGDEGRGDAGGNR